jgi:hypothetical protein
MEHTLTMCANFQDTRDTLPFCDGTNVERCFDVESKQVVSKNGRVAQKDFSDVITWE